MVQMICVLLSMAENNKTHNKGNTADRFAPADFFVGLLMDTDYE
jgi:hypothetical protein